MSITKEEIPSYINELNKINSINSVLETIIQNKEAFKEFGLEVKVYKKGIELKFS